MSVTDRINSERPARAHSENEWFGDDAFWTASYSYFFPESRFTAGVAEVDQMLALAKCERGHVLDLGCGPGRHSIPLATRGLTVTGVDYSPFLLRRARERSAEVGATVEWVRADMKEFRRADAFDLALCCYTALGYFRDDADNQRVIESAAHSLRPGGAFVVDVVGKEVLARIFNGTSSSEVEDGVFFKRRTINDDWCRMESEWVLVRRGTVHATYRFGHWVYSAREIKRMFSDAGLVDVQVFGSYAGDPYGPNAGRLVALGRKPGTRGAS